MSIERLDKDLIKDIRMQGDKVSQAAYCFVEADLTGKEIEAVLGVSKQTAYNWVRNKVVIFERGRRPRYVEQREQAAA